jgi:hypothetical protein
MNHYYIFRIFLILSLLITLISGRAVYYEQLDDDDNIKSFSNEDESKINENKYFSSIILLLFFQISHILTPNYRIYQMIMMMIISRLIHMKKKNSINEHYLVPHVHHIQSQLILDKQ